MTSKERERMYALCEQIAKEKDHGRFLKVVQKLNQLLESQEGRLQRGTVNPDTEPGPENQGPENQIL